MKNPVHRVKKEAFKKNAMEGGVAQETALKNVQRKENHYQFGSRTRPVESGSEKESRQLNLSLRDRKNGKKKKKN